MDDNDSLEEIAAHMRECDNFVIGGHVSPDGDCVGSQLALWAALSALGKNAVCVSASSDPLPYSLMFLPGASEIICGEAVDVPCDTYVAVDVSDEPRFGNGQPSFKEASTTFILDHHRCDDRIAQWSYVDPYSPSASMLIWKLVRILCEEPPAASALCAYTGLMTDTGGFRFQNTNAEAFEVASELVSYGADPSLVATQVFQNQSLASLCLEKVALDHMSIFADGEGVLTFISRADIEECGARKSDTDHLIDVIRSVRGVRVACILREENGFIKGSLRAKDDTDVASLAATLDGGGHRAAAGFTLHMPLTEAVPFMCEKISELLSGSDQR